jgi:hypothetical protein
MMRKPATLALGLVLLVAPAAFGSSRTVSDGRDTTQRRIDIKAVSHGHKNGKLKHTVVAYERFKTSRGPCVTFETNGGGRKDYQVCGYENMIDLHQQVTNATVNIQRPDRRTIVYIFRRKAIGRPGSYKWFVEEPGPDECPNCDRAPNSGMVRHNI